MMSYLDEVLEEVDLDLSFVDPELLLPDISLEVREHPGMGVEMEPIEVPVGCWGEVSWGTGMEF